MVIEPRDRHIDDLTNDAMPEASDHQQISRARARSRATELTIASPFSSLLLHLPFSLSLSLSLCLFVVTTLARPARNHLLCTWLEADCYPGILPFLRPGWPSPDTWSHEPRSAWASHKDFLMRWVWLHSITIALSLAEGSRLKPRSNHSPRHSPAEMSFANTASLQASETLTHTFARSFRWIEIHLSMKNCLFEFLFSFVFLFCFENVWKCSE